MLFYIFLLWNFILDTLTLDLNPHYTSFITPKVLGYPIQSIISPSGNYYSRRSNHNYTSEEDIESSNHNYTLEEYITSSTHSSTSEKDTSSYPPYVNSSQYLESIEYFNKDDLEKEQLLYKHLKNDHVEYIKECNVYIPKSFNLLSLIIIPEVFHKNFLLRNENHWDNLLKLRKLYNKSIKLKQIKLKIINKRYKIAKIFKKNYKNIIKLKEIALKLKLKLKNINLKSNIINHNINHIINSLPNIISPIIPNINTILYTHTPKYTNNNTLIKSSEVQSNSICPTVRSSTPDVNSTSLNPAVSSFNYLSLKSKATPGDRGIVEVSDWTSSGRPVADLREAKGQLNREGCLQDEKKIDYKTSSGILESDLRELEGELNRESCLQDDEKIEESILIGTAIGDDTGKTSSGRPVADLREAKGQLNREGCLQDEKKIDYKTSSGIPESDLRELEGEVNREGATPSGKTSSGGEWKDKVVTSSGTSNIEGNDIVSYDKIRPVSSSGLSHFDILDRMGGIYVDKGSDIVGTSYSVYGGCISLLSRALINYLLDINTKIFGYNEIILPVIINKKYLYKTGHLPRFENNLYKLHNRHLINGVNGYLIPTSEVSLLSINNNKRFNINELPILLTSYTQCFRNEIQKYGLDTRGLIRLSQFDKIELLCLNIDKLSNNSYYLMIEHIKYLLNSLELPFRIIQLSKSNINHHSFNTIDFEVYFPILNKFIEISSCSHTKDYQTYKLNIFTNNHHIIHAINGTALPIGRTISAILENHHHINYNGKIQIHIPKPLQKYTNTNIITENEQFY